MAELKSDGELLRDYVEQQSEIAFGELVERHTNLVFATANRGVTDAAAAQEITQSVFIALARKAFGLRREVSVAGWLHKTTLLEVRQWWRGEMRRRQREQTAAALGTTMKDEESLIHSMSGLLDDGLMHLRDGERELLLLRYFENRSHREIGATLGAGEDAVRKRIDKALTALTNFFRRRGFVVPATTITAAALSAAAQPAPAGLSAIVTKVALTSTGTGSVTAMGTLLDYVLGLTRTQAVGTCLVVVAIPLTYHLRVTNSLANERAAWERQLAATAAAISSHNEGAAAMNRRLAQVQNRQASLEAQAKASPNLAAIAVRAVPNEPPQYLWAEESPYVTVPKDVLKDLGLPALPRALGSAFSLSPVMTEALSLQPAELTRINGLLTELKSAHDQLVASLAQPTERHIHWFSPNNGPMRSFIVPPFPEEGDALMAQLKINLQQTLGLPRTDLLWPHLEGDLRNRLSEIGRFERRLTMHLAVPPEGDFRPAYYEDIRGKYGRGIHAEPPDFLKQAAAEARPSVK